MNENQEKALARVKKMLAIANCEGASEGERDNAMRMAHATLAKHNLSLVDAADTPEEKRGDVTLETLCWPWMRTTSHAISELFFCTYFFVRTRKNYVKHYFVGRLSNATTASELSAYVIDSIQKEASKAKRASPWAGSDFVVSFCKGAAHKVYHRAAQLRKDAEAESQAAPTTRANGTALVLASVYATELEANKKHLAEVMKLRLKSGVNRERRSSADAYHQGAAFGDRVSLSRQIGGGSNGRKQLSK